MIRNHNHWIPGYPVDRQAYIMKYVKHTFVWQTLIFPDTMNMAIHGLNQAWDLFDIQNALMVYED
jgi:hypothetical protein